MKRPQNLMTAFGIAAFAFAAGCGAAPAAEPQPEPEPEPIAVSATASQEPVITDAGAAPVPRALPERAEGEEAPAPEPPGKVSYGSGGKAGCDLFAADPCGGRLISENGLAGMPVDYGACRIPARPLGDVRKVTAVVDGVRLSLRAEDVRRAVAKRCEGEERKRFPVEAAILAAIDAPGGAKELVFSFSSGAEADRAARERWGFLLTGLLQASPFEVRDAEGAPVDHLILYDWGYYCGPLCGASGHAVYTPACRRVYYSLEMIS
jgi:hypothetical protein